jgi:hypothetical protein
VITSTKVGIFSIILFCCIAICFMSLFSRFKISEIDNFSFHTNSGEPRFVKKFLTVKKSALEMIWVFRFSLGVSIVLIARSLSKILPSIIVLNTVDVVDMLFRPFSRNPEPRQTMSQVGSTVFAAAKPNLPVSTWVRFPGDSSSLPKPSYFDPCKNTRIQIVMDKGAQFPRFYKIVISHVGLLIRSLGQGLAIVCSFGEPRFTQWGEA